MPTHPYAHRVKVRISTREDIEQDRREWRERRELMGVNPFYDFNVPPPDEDRAVVVEMNLDPFDE